MEKVASSSAILLYRSQGLLLGSIGGPKAFTHQAVVSRRGKSPSGLGGSPLEEEEEVGIGFWSMGHVDH